MPQIITKRIKMKKKRCHPISKIKNPQIITKMENAPRPSIIKLMWHTYNHTGFIIFVFPFTAVTNTPPVREAAERVLPRACFSCSYQLQAQTRNMRT